MRYLLLLVLYWVSSIKLNAFTCEQLDNSLELRNYITSLLDRDIITNWISSNNADGSLEQYFETKIANLMTMSHSSDSVIISEMTDAIFVDTVISNYLMHENFGEGYRPYQKFIITKHDVMRMKLWYILNRERIDIVTVRLIIAYDLIILLWNEDIKHNHGIECKLDEQEKMLNCLINSKLNGYIPLPQW